MAIKTYIKHILNVKYISIKKIKLIQLNKFAFLS